MTFFNGHSNGNSNASCYAKDGVFVKVGTERLRKQGEKQILLSQIYDEDKTCFRVPTVFPNPKNTELHMEYIESKPVVEYLETCSPYNVIKLWETMEASIESVERRSVISILPAPTIVAKMESLRSQIDSKYNPYCYRVIDLLLSHHNNLMLIGFCHGDLTLCNMIATADNAFYTLDMLDCFLEAPVQDMVCLMQDVFFGWWQLFYSKPISVKLQLYIHYLKTKLVSRIFRYNQHILKGFFILKILRIIPYAQGKPHIMTWIDDTLSKTDLIFYQIYKTHEFSKVTKCPSISDQSTLIIAAAGLSSRFQTTKPKYLLTQPSGKLMIFEAMEQLDFSIYSRIIVTVLQKHMDLIDAKKFLLHLQHSFDSRIEILALAHETKDCVETISETITQKKIIGFVTIKDCDNTFKEIGSPPTGMVTSVAAIFCPSTIDLKNKSTISLGEDCSLVNIHEKTGLENLICVSGYRVPSHFITDFPIHCAERPMSSVILWSMLQEPDTKVQVRFVTNYKDWGTMETWLQYKSTFKTFFIDLDGTLFKNTGEFDFISWGQNEVLSKNVEWLLNLSDSCCIILTTSRPEAYRQQTMEQLQKWQIPFHSLLMGLPHCARYLINDYSATNPFPSAVALSVQRDADDIEQHLH